MTRKPVNLPASVAGRLRDLARERQSDYQLMLRRYAIERLLYRISRSKHRRRFILKGAMLFAAWSPDPFRATQDLDLLGFGDATPEAMIEAFRSIVLGAVTDDGLAFDPATIAAAPIRGRQEYGGIRVKMTASLGKTRISVQVDVGFGDVVTPAPVELDYPALLDGPPPRLRTYPRETVVAEKLQAIVGLGQINSRMKDFYDIAALARTFAFGGAELASALRATFERRRTALPLDVPTGLSDAFAGDPGKLALWSAFTRREALLHDVGDLASIVGEIWAFVLPPCRAAATEKPFVRTWKPGGPWRAQRKRRRTE